MALSSDDSHDRMGPAARGFSRDERKEIVKDAIKEWLNETASAFGWWSLKMLAALFAAGIVIFILWSHGWTRMP